MTKDIAYAIIEKIFREMEMILKQDALTMKKKTMQSGAGNAPRFFDFSSLLILSVGD